MNITTTTDKFRVLRARIESELAIPAVILVTAACTEDNTSVVASGLADAFTQAGYRTARVDVDRSYRSLVADSPTVVRLTEVETSQRIQGVCGPSKLDLVAIHDDQVAPVSREAARVISHRLRAAYDVTVIVTSRFSGSDLPLLFATASDGVLLTVRSGRQPLPEDAGLVSQAEQGNTRVLGIVMTGSKGEITEAPRRQFAAKVRPNKGPLAENLSTERTLTHST